MRVKRLGSCILLSERQKRFWTESLRLYFPFELSGESATSASLFCSVLMRGSRKYPDIVSLERALERLYGMSVDFNIVKLGDSAILKVTLKIPKGEYTPSGRRLKKDALELFSEILFHPTGDGLFDASYFEQERRMLAAQLSAIRNNRTLYSGLLFLKKFCPKEPYRLYEQGDAETAARLTNEKVHRFYRRIIKETPFVLYTNGFEPDEVLDALAGLGKGAGKLSPLKQRVRPARRRVVRAKEYMDVKQAQFWMGFRGEIEAGEERATAAQLLSAVFGGLPVSRLFKRVREKHSLAYEVHSSYIRSKGMMVVYAAVEPKNIRKVERLVLDEWRRVVEAGVGEEELAVAKRFAVQGLRSLKDSPLALADFRAFRLLLGMDETPYQRIKSIRRVSVDDIISVAESIELDTVFALLQKECR